MSQQTLKNALAEINQSKPPQNLKSLDDFLNRHKAQFMLAMPKHMNPDRMIRLALTAFNDPKAPGLRKCSMQSIAASIVTASQMGLEIGVQGQGYLVPYKDTCQFIPGWQGIVDLVNRAGKASVWTGAVFSGDEFDYALGDSPFVKHRPAGENDPAKLMWTYAIGRVNGSQWPVIEVWTNERLKRHFERFNKVGDRHYAHQHWEAYARKIPLLQVCKYMPKSIELNTAINIEDAMSTGKAFTMEGEFAVLGDAPETDGNQVQGITFADVQAAMQKAVTTDALDDAWSTKDLVQGLTKEQEVELGKVYATRDAELRK